MCNLLGVFFVCVCLDGVCVPFSLTGGVPANFFAVAARPLAMAWFFTPTLWLLSSTLLGTSTRAETQTPQSVQRNSPPALKHKHPNQYSGTLTCTETQTPQSVQQISPPVLKHKHPNQYSGTLHLRWNTNTPISTAELSTCAETQTPQLVQRNSPPALKHTQLCAWKGTLHVK